MNNRDLHFPEEGFNRPLFLPNDKLEVVSFRQGVRKRKSRTASVIAWIQLVGWLIYFAINLINHLRFNLSETPAKNSLLSQTLSAFVYEFSQITFIWVTISSILSIVGLHKRNPGVGLPRLQQTLSGYPYLRLHLLKTRLKEQFLKKRSSSFSPCLP